MSSAPLLNKDDHGQKIPHDPAWAGLKNEGRGCHDIIFVLLFLATIVGFVWTSALGFQKGNPQLLLTYEGNEVPSDIEDSLKEHVMSALGQAIAEVKRDYPVIIGATVLAIVLAFVWTFLLRCCTKIFIYLTFLLGISLIAAVSIYLLALSQQRNEPALKWAAIVGFVITGILLLLMLFLRKKIAMTAMMMRESAKGVQHNPAVLVVTLIVVIFFIGFAGYWTASMVYIYSVPDDSLRNALYFNVFAFLWITGVLSGIIQMTVAGGIAFWYFSRSAQSAQNGPASPALTTFVRALTKSLGSIAFGTLIAAVVAFVNFLLNRARQQSPNRLVRFLICCVQCCLSCIQGIVKFVNKFAFIYCAMYGDSYCSSAKSVFNLMSRNAFSVIVVDFIGDFVLFVGKIFGTAASTVLAVAILEHTDRQVSGVTLALVIVIAFSVFHLFGHVIGIGVDSVFVCYLEDLERNEKSKKYFMDPESHTTLSQRATELAK